MNKQPSLFKKNGVDPMHYVSSFKETHYKKFIKLFKQ